MGNELQHSPFFSKLVRFLFFVIGLSLGITICEFSVNFKSFSFNLQGLISSSLIMPPPLITLPLSETHVQKSLMHSMDDKELFWRATSMDPKEKKSSSNNGEIIINDDVPKIAFMFLTKGTIHLAPLWEMFFKGHQGRYTVYVHTHPSFNWSMPEDSVFYGTRIPSKEVQWGKPSMIDAERRLLANALLDSSNQRFILLSETCIPLFNFTTIYNYLIHVNQSFVASYDDPRKIGRGRYNPKMAPTITISDWRKGSQWFEVNRKIAMEIVSDTKYYPIFSELCYPPCYMDEHYIPTLVNMCCSQENLNTSITFVDWSKSGPHPGRFGRNDISLERLNQIRFNCTNDLLSLSANSYDASSSFSSSSSSSSLCFLFGRKFMSDSLRPLLRIAPVLLGID